jgi:hypothetical protein
MNSVTLPPELWSQVFLLVAEAPLLIAEPLGLQTEHTFPLSASLLVLMLVCRTWRVRTSASSLGGC